MSYSFASQVRMTFFGDECILHNLDNGRWLKIKKQTFQFLRDFCKKGVNEIQPRLEKDGITISEFHDFVRCLCEYRFLADEHSQRERVERNFLIAAYLNITERCNLQCKTCYFAAKKVATVKEMSIKECSFAMDKLAEAGVKHLIIAGGEPTLRSDVAKILLYARKRFSNVTLITNGTLLTAELAEKIVDSVDLLQVSIDGPNDEINSQIRGKGAFNEAIRGITLLKKAGAKKILLVCTVTSVNINSIPEMAKLANSLGVEFGSSIFLASGYGACNEGCLSPVWQDLLLDFRNEIFQVSEKEDQIFCERNGGVSSLRIGLSCGAATLLISIGPDGTVYPCHVFHKPEFRIGNLLEDDCLLDILNRSPVVKHFRKLDVEHKADCKSCDVRYFCRGGCIAQAFISNGRLDARDKFCPLFKKVFRAQVWSINDHMSEKEKAKHLLDALKI